MERPDAPQELILRPYQQTALRWIMERERSAIWAGMGMGKTTVGMLYLDALHTLLGESRPSLVLGPTRVARSVWPREAKKWDLTADLDVRCIQGTPAEREAQLRADFPVHVVNYELLPWLRKFWGKKWPYATVIADESTRLKNFRASGGGQRAAALRGAAWTRVKRWVNLTGTPAPNGLADLWGQTWFLDKGERLGTSFGAFERRWFAYQRPPGSRSVHELKRIVLPGAEEQIHERLQDICLTLEPSDWFDLHEPIRSRVSVTLSGGARERYVEMEKELFTVLESGAEIESPTVGANLMRCLQLSSGAIWTDPARRGWEEIHDEKLDALESVVEECGGSPLLVVYFFRHTLERLQRRFKTGRVFDADPRTEDAWNRGEIPVMFIHPGSAGHGVNLQQGGHHMAFVDHWWDTEQRDQVIERIGPVRQYQAGFDRPVYLYDIVAERTIDEVVLLKHHHKGSVQQALRDYMNPKRRG